MLAAPIIGGTLPAFYKESDGTVKLTVPFSMSRAVHPSQIKGFKIKIKDIQGTNILATANSSQIDYANCLVTFSIESLAAYNAEFDKLQTYFKDADLALEQKIEEYKENLANLETRYFDGVITYEQYLTERESYKVEFEAIQKSYAYDKQEIQGTLEYQQQKLKLDAIVNNGYCGFNPGVFYKIQIAYVDLFNTVGYYSTVGVAKCTTRPNVFIFNLDASAANGHIYTYLGGYSQGEDDQDKTEKVYSYRFVLEDKDGNILKDTGYLTHNHSNDANEYESQDSFTYFYDLKRNEKYYLIYWVKTNNNLEIASPKYTIMQKKAVSMTSPIAITAKLDSENACIKLSLEGEKNSAGEELTARGSFVITRSSDKFNYSNWEKIIEFDLSGEVPSSKTWNDFTIEQGVLYKYAIQQYNRVISSERVETPEPIYADFEHSYLYDGKRQLKIKFNPKISSFKTDLLESKVDTIGGKFPFVFRNGIVNYKEFPISGLISYQSDEQDMFILQEDFEDNQHRLESRFYVGVDFPRDPIHPYAEEQSVKKLYVKDYSFYYFKISDGVYVKWDSYAPSLNTQFSAENWDSVKDFVMQNLTRFYLEKRRSVNQFSEQQLIALNNQAGYEFAREREFKLEALNWLTNGEPKLFKSPSEGNYLVRLMNVSLSPMDQVGRMLHTFSCTAYEIAELNYDSLLALGIIDINEHKKEILKIATIPLYTNDENYARLNDYIYEKQGNGWFAKIKTNLLYYTGEIERFVLEDVPTRTQFEINGVPVIIGANGYLTGEMPVSSVELMSQVSRGQLTVYYYEQGVNSPFSHIKDIDIRDVLGRQIIGECVAAEKQLESTDKTVNSYYDIKFIKRHVEDLKASKVKDNEYTLSTIGGAPVANCTFMPSQNCLNTTIVGENLSPLDCYKFQVSADPWIGSLYHPVTYIKISNQDTGYELERNLAERTASNKYIQNFPDDFENDIKNQRVYEFVKSKSGWTFQKIENTPEAIENAINNFLVDRFYAYLEPIEYVLVPEQPTELFLTQSCYNNMKAMCDTIFKKSFGEMDLTEILSIYRPYKCESEINGGVLSLDYINQFSTGPLETAYGINMSPGVYCELYYQEQQIIYDVSGNADARDAQEILTMYAETLSCTEMLNKCISEDGKQAYYQQLLVVYNNYHQVYENYLNALERYLRNLI